MCQRNILHQNFATVPKKQILASLATGATVSAVARAFSTTRQTVMRIRDVAARADCDILPSEEQDKS